MDRIDTALSAQAAAFYDDTATWRDRRGYDLSDRLWGNRQRQRTAIDQVIRDGIRNGASLDDVAQQLTSWIRPGVNGGTAHYSATRLANNEMRRSYSLATRDTATVDPTAGFLRFNLNPAHIDTDVCDDYANHDEGLGRGVYPARDCPLPPVHIGDKCDVESVPWDRTGTPAARGMSDFVEQLRVEYGLDDPPDLSPDELVTFRRETAGIRQAVQFMVRAWFEQAGLVTPEQLLEASPTVAAWVADVKAEKARRRRR